MHIRPEDYNTPVRLVACVSSVPFFVVRPTFAFLFQESLARYQVESTQYVRCHENTQGLRRFTEPTTLELERDLVTLA